MSASYTLVAPCFFGTEATLAFEVRRLGAENVQVTDGRVQFSGPAPLIAAANLNLRTAERVLLHFLITFVFSDKTTIIVAFNTVNNFFCSCQNFFLFWWNDNI